MIKGKNLLHIFLLAVFAVLSVGNANAQIDSLIRVGDSLYKAYRFDDAVDVFYEALDMAEDTTSALDSVVIDAVSERLRLAENGSNMSRFVRTPKVVGRKKLSLDEFVLAYPLEDKSWRTLPNSLDSTTANPFVRALYAPDWNDRLYYSADDENGVRKIYETSIQDTLWSVPAKIDEVSSDFGSEIYPMLSPDGKTLYFSSNGLYGLGGYDLYYSTWDEESNCWSMPRNMGIPFSSPDDDFLFIDSEDEKYSMFASNRDCSADSVWVYALEYDRAPLHTSIDDPEELYKLSRLHLKKSDGEEPKGDGKQDDLTAVYMAQMDSVRSLRDSISSVSGQLDQLRMDLAFSNDDSERYELSSVIIEKEKLIPELQKELKTAQEELQKTEYEFIRKGVFFDPNYSDKKDQEDPELIEYEFAMRSYGGPLQLNIAVPEVKFDYSFRILDEALYAEDQSLPAGIYYQIQLFGGRKAALSELKGLSPIYEHRSPSGMYIYRVGRFSNYDEALEKIYKVRNLGFKSAYICAFDNGVEISVAKARTLQERLKGGFALYEIRIMPESGELDPAVSDTVASIAVGKDIIRTEAEDGTQVFTVGPFDSRESADALVNALNGILTGRVICESIN